MIWMLIAAAVQDMTPINVPYQAEDAFSAYVDCVGGHLRTDARSAGTAAEVRQANADAVTACHEVRVTELARGMAAVSDKRTPVVRPFKSRAEARAAVGQAFDRFDADYEIK